MTRDAATASGIIVLGAGDYRVLGASEFGADGLEAVESIGPFVELQAFGPLVTVHDARIAARSGIGHHPHRYNERLFYMLTGSLDHDDVLNHITGHMGEGELGRLTEGLRGMIHSEWNHGDAPSRAFILVYATEPLPERASFALLGDAAAPREERAGVRTKELVGPRSPLQVHGDIRLYTDDVLDAGARLDLELADEAGALVWVEHGRVRADGREAGAGETLLVPPGGARHLALEALEPSRLLRVVHGPGFGVRQRSGTLTDR